MPASIGFCDLVTSAKLTSYESAFSTTPHAQLILNLLVGVSAFGCGGFSVVSTLTICSAGSGVSLKFLATTLMRKYPSKRTLKV